MMSFKIFCLGVLFCGVSCDIKCFIEKQIPRIEDLYDKNPGFNIQLCKFAKDYYNDTRNDMKTCSTKKISVNKAEAFTKDLCTVGWDLNNEYLKYEDCFGKNIGNAKECLTDFPTTKPDKDKELEYMKSVCQKLDDLYKCFNEKVGKACGTEALGLTQKLTEAVSSYTTGLCLEVNGAVTNSVLHWTILLAFSFVLLTWSKY